ncbi:hypothetical protein [Chryseobacterium indologenes]|uniref:Uncharacterized protein n=1 Tax=Chryseobacterium indologenes TaxID=253 RepID=A0A0N0IV39_CHRID|nr:hypothetical protein [Chryseobacterium indologenes]KPE50122.1 hypothetical protein AOB46_16925 [Chryseobacterium indologenes]
MKSTAKINTQEKKLNNKSFPALRDIEIINGKSGYFDRFREGLIKFTSVLNHFNWDLRDDKEFPHFHSLGLSMTDLYRAGAVSKYQRFCIIKLSSILYDARLLYENNLIDFTQLHGIVVRVKKDAFRRFKSIEKAHAKKQLVNNQLDADSLLLLQAKLAILENEN